MAARPAERRATVSASRGGADRYPGEEKCVSANNSRGAAQRPRRAVGRCRSDRAAALGEGCAASGRLDGHPLCRPPASLDHRRQCGLPAIGRRTRRRSSPIRPHCRRPPTVAQRSPAALRRRGRRKRHRRARLRSLRTPQTAPMRRNDPIADLIGSAAIVRRPLARHGGAARAVRFRLWPDQAVRHSRRADECGDRRNSSAIDKMPVTGRLSDRLLSELAAMIGHPIE